MWTPGRPVTARARSSHPRRGDDALVLHGSFGSCREQILAYAEAGITIPAIAIVPFGVELRDAVRGLAPAA